MIQCMGPIHYKKNGWGFSSFLFVFLFFFSLYKFAQPSFARAPAQSPEHITVAPFWPSSFFSPDGARKCPGSAPAPSWAYPAPGRGPGPVAAAPSAAPLRAAWHCVPSGHLHGDLAPQVLPSPPSTAALQHRHPAWRRGLRLGLPRRLRPFHFQTPSALVCGH